MFFKHIFKSSPHDRVYLDFASSTPLDYGMLKQIPKIGQDVLGANPSGLHKEGVGAKTSLEEARSLVASTLHAHKDEIIFTSSATESNNLAIIGTIERFISDGLLPSEIVVFVSSFEHSAVTEPILKYAQLGVTVIELKVVDGIVDPKSILLPEKSKAVLITCMYVNNEIGTVQPIREIAKRVRYLRKENKNIEIVFHVDATQAPAHFPLHVQSLGMEMMTLGSTKLYCHKGVGLLYKKRNTNIKAIFLGGGQEGGMRPGTEPLMLVRQFAYALAYAQKIQNKENERVKSLKKYFEDSIKQKFPQAKITAQNVERSPHISHVAIKDFDSELLVLELDAKGISISAKSACKNEDSNESAIIQSIYGYGYGAIRFSFGRPTKKEDLDKVIVALKSIILKYLPKN